MLNGLDLFSGEGALALALAPYIRPVAYCEIDRYAQAILLSKMAEGALPVAPIWDDVCTLRREYIAGHRQGQHDDGESIDIITAGSPCQNISPSGDRTGLEGKESRLFWEVIRLTDEFRPGAVFLENSSRMLLYIDQVIQAFRDIGYRLDPDDYGLLAAYEVGAVHERDRWWALAYPESQGLPDWGRLERQSPQNAEVWKRCILSGFERYSLPRFETEPGISPVDDGTPYRVDQVKCHGRAVVPRAARTAFEILTGIGKKGAPTNGS